MRPSTARLVLTPTTVVLVFGAIVAAVLARNVFVAARRPLGWAIAALVMAAAIEPLVSLVSRHMRRGLAHLRARPAHRRVGTRGPGRLPGPRQQHRQAQAGAPGCRRP